MEIGTDYIGVTCIFVCHDGNGKVLLHKRSNKTRDEHGRWDFGGGKLHHGETWDEAVTREVQEEYCARSQSIEHFHTFNALWQHNRK